MSEQVFTIFQVTYTLVMTSLLGCVVSMIKGHSLANKNGKEADKLLLRKALIDTHDKAVKDGYITRYEFDAFNETWELYHNGYKANSLTDKFHKEVQNLEVRE